MSLACKACVVATRQEVKSLALSKSSLVPGTLPWTQVASNSILLWRERIKFGVSTSKRIDATALAAAVLRAMPIRALRSRLGRSHQVSLSAASMARRASLSQTRSRQLLEPWAPRPSSHLALLAQTMMSLTCLISATKRVLAMKQSCSTR